MSTQSRLKVSGIPLKYTDKNIKSLLSFGAAKHVNFSRTPSYPSTSIVVYVAYNSDVDAKYMIWVLDGKEIDGYKIKAVPASSHDIFEHKMKLRQKDTMDELVKLSPNSCY